MMGITMTENVMKKFPVACAIMQQQEGIENVFFVCLIVLQRIGRERI
jgi:hypothetical protein